MKGQTKRTEQDIIVLGLIGIYIIAVGVLGVYRMWREEYSMMILDWSLAGVSLVIFIYGWHSRNIRLSSYYVAILAVIGVELTVVFKGIGQIFWAYPAVTLVFYLLPAKHAIILWSMGLFVLAILIREASVIEIVIISSTLIVTSLFCLLFALKMKQQNDNLRRMARQDVLTKVHNRRAFYEDLKNRKASGEKLTAIFIDLDNFKNVNDRLGHVKGDAVLTSVADIIKDFLKSKHCLYRLGGDEFVVLTHQLDWHDVCDLSKTIHQQFAKNLFAKKHQLTLSMAVGSHHNSEYLSQWLNRLDTALYDAKKKGRNQVVFVTN